MVVGSCGYSGSGVVAPQVGSNWSPTISGADLAIVQQVFPLYLPTMVSPGTSLCGSGPFLPTNVSPSSFFGAGQSEDMKPTPGGIMVQTNGFDSPNVATPLPSEGTYFDCSDQPFIFNLDVVSPSPLNLYQAQDGIAQTPGAAAESVDLNEGTVSLAEIDSTLQFVKQQLAIALPAVAGVDEHNVEIVIEPTIFYVTDTNFGNTWAGGMTQSLGGGKYRIHVVVFFMYQPVNGNYTVANWKDYLIFEAMNFYLESVGSAVSFDARVSRNRAIKPAGDGL
jgi:hypothetical protein